ncbi:barstar family protein [Sinomicrobium weinanense]|uniref:Barstar family protein n=1 Tax=Sinomicrobium weinanense TaxID=2842200 RepID=A0A926JVJ7_9FLAO|nr:barstar family protein [Sinomicrobium weinanense]MBC9798362.1 barstar family protein [Sinomicrobium weinanense]MBU3122427.1 barstar family protein [Sinomicrobium weinanense]
MIKFKIDGRKLKDWNSFHAEFKAIMDFPDYYGKNMDAWIDCVDELTDKPTLLQIEHGKLLREKAPELYMAILECGAFVNYRKLEAGEQPNLVIATDA